MDFRRPGRLALGISLLGAAAILTGFLFFSLQVRDWEIEDGQARLKHFGAMFAEHTARSLDAVDVLLYEMASDISRNGNWHQWNDLEGYSYLSRRHTKALPQVRLLIMIDPDGRQRFMSSQFPANAISVADRPYFQTLVSGVARTTWGPYVGRNTGRSTYAIAHRLQNGRYFDGIIFAALETTYFQEFCWHNRISDDFQGALVNAAGAIVAYCQPKDGGIDEALIGRPVFSVLGSGALSKVNATTTSRANGWLITQAPVTHFSDLYVVAAVPEAALLDTWATYSKATGFLAALVIALLVLGGLLLRRQLEKLRGLNISVEDQRQHLQHRIQAATRELRRQKDDAERANASKSRFLAAATHDLRQPLTALSLFAADLERQVQNGDKETLVRLSSRINASARGLRTLIDALLDFSCIDVERITPNLQPCDLNHLFSILERTFSCAAEEKQIGLSFRDTRLMAYADPILLERLLGNLIANAINYTYQGRVLVAARKRGSSLWVEVVDTGIGIPEEQQTHIFEEFYQVENTAREHHKGLGLGLAIVSKLSKVLNATIAVKSIPGKGSRFTLTLPLVTQPLAAWEKNIAPTPASSLDEVLPMIYLIGASSTLADAKNFLSDWGYDVHEVPDFTALPTHANDQTLIIMDLELSHGQLPQAAARHLIVALGGPSEGLPPWIHQLPKPLRPARLRTLLRRLQEQAGVLVGIKSGPDGSPLPAPGSD